MRMEREGFTGHSARKRPVSTAEWRENGNRKRKGNPGACMGHKYGVPAINVFNYGNS